VAIAFSFIDAICWILLHRTPAPKSRFDYTITGLTVMRSIRKSDFLLFWNCSIGLPLIFDGNFLISSYLSGDLKPDFITIVARLFWQKTGNRK